MKQHITTVILAVGAGVLAALATYGAFTLGFNVYAIKLPHYEQTQAIEAVNDLQLHVSGNNTAQQSYNDAAHYLLPTISPYNTNTTELVHNDMLTITPTIQQLIKDTYTKGSITVKPEWIQGDW